MVGVGPVSRGRSCRERLEVDQIDDSRLPSLARIRAYVVVRLSLVPRQQVHRKVCVQIDEHEAPPRRIILMKQRRRQTRQASVETPNGNAARVFKLGARGFKA